SYSLCGWLNCSYTANGFDWVPQTYPWAQLKLSTMRQPSAVFGFMDEQEQSIDAGMFIIEQPIWVEVNSENDNWYSLPADRHRQGCNLSFLDGHVEHWRWKAPKIFKQSPQYLGGREDFKDFKRLQAGVWPEYRF